MKSAKFFIIFIFLLTFAICGSAQEQMPKIVWKNVQKKYQKFEDVKPVIINEGDKTVYMFADVKLGILHDYLRISRLYEGNVESFLYRHSHPTNKKIEAKIMSNFKIEPSQERPIIFDKEDWHFLVDADGVVESIGFRDNPEYKGKGYYKLKLQFYVVDKKSRRGRL